VSNDPEWDDIFSSQPDAARPAPAAAPLTRRQLREAEGRERTPVGEREEPRVAAGAPTPRRPRGGGGDGGGNWNGLPKRKRRLGWLWALLTLVVIAGGGAFAVWTLFEPQVREVMGWQLPTDYTGSGNGQEVTVVINDGDIGEDIAKTLHDQGVTMTFDAFYDVLLEKEPTFMPGTYKLQKKMSAESALTALQDPANRVVAGALIIEGTTLPTALKSLSDGTGIPLADFEAASKDLASFGLPPEAPSLEGYLFPATYEFEPNQTAQQILQRLVTETFTRLDAAGVAVADRHRVLTLAALVQKEGGPEADFPKVARVFQNRIDQGMRLQSDATVSYGAGSKSIFTTDAERADASNPYNTYANDGLPVGPISAPGEAAIQAVLNPTPGPWLYFVLVNGKTGETAFSTTGAEHEAAVKVWRKWVKDNPDWNTGG
jgi:UPF0755 protein